MFGIHLTGHCAAKRSTVRWRRDKLQSDMFLQRPYPPLKRHVSWRPVNLINQQLSPQKLEASIVLLHGQVHPLSAHLISTPTPAGDECSITCSWGRKRKPESPCVPFRLVSSPLFLFFFSFCCHFLSLVLFGFHSCTTHFLRRSHVYYNVKSSVPGSCLVRFFFFP